MPVNVLGYEFSDIFLERAVGISFGFDWGTMLCQYTQLLFSLLEVPLFLTLLTHVVIIASIITVLIRAAMQRDPADLDTWGWTTLKNFFFIPPFLIFSMYSHWILLRMWTALMNIPPLPLSPII